MRISDFGRYGLGFCGAVAILGGCGSGAQSRLAPSAPFQQGLVNMDKSGAAQTGVVALHPDRGPSWMAPGAAAHELLYISNLNGENVLVYSYPQHKLVGTLTGFDQPDGVCSDKKGDVWIVNNGTAKDVVEYGHGGTKPIATLNESAELLVGCSVDPTTGNLAVTNASTYLDGRGSVAIFTHAKGTPTLYTDPKMYYVYFCGYDDKGNLYIDGFPYGSYGFRFAELPKGKKTFTNITLTGGTIKYAGNVRWDGKYGGWRSGVRAKYFGLRFSDFPDHGRGWKDRKRNTAAWFGGYRWILD
jgi:hypothetical protein